MSMKHILLLLPLLLLCGCNGAKRSFLGSWKERAEVTVVNKMHNVPVGHFVIQQDQKYWADELDKCETHLRYTNTSRRVQNFNFKIQFSLRSPERVGHWTYQNAVVDLQPNQSISFGEISKRVASIKDGSIYVFTH